MRVQLWALLFLAPTLPAQSDSTPRSVRLPDGVVEFEARGDGRVAIGAVGTVRMGVAAGVFAPLALLSWLDDLDVLAGVAGTAGRTTADTVPLQSVDGALIVLASRARSERDQPGLMLTFVRAASRASNAPSAPIRLFLPLAADSATPPPLVRLRAAAAAAVERARALAPPVAAAGPAGRDAAGGPPKRMPTPDRLFITFTIGVTGAIAGARLDGAVLGCELYSCWRPGVEGFAVGGAVGYALGAALTRQRALCPARRAATLAALGAAIGAVPGLVVAASNRPRLSLPLMLVGQGAGAVVAGRWC